MILIVGSTGDLGSQITQRLLAEGEPVRVLTRHHPPHPKPTPLPVEHVVADLKDPGSLREACAGIRTVITTATAAARSAPDTLDSVDLTGNLNLIEAAETSGVERFVLVSALGAQPEHPMPLLRAKGMAEQRLRDSAMAWTILQPDVFMDRLIPIVVGEPALGHRAVTLVGTGRRKHSFVAMRDVAAYAVAALHHPHAQARTIMIGGPQPLSWHDIVATFEQQLGRNITVRTVDPGDVAPDLPDFVTQLLTALDGYDSPIDMGQNSSTYGVEPTELTEFVRTYVSTVHHLAG